MDTLQERLDEMYLTKTSTPTDITHKIPIEYVNHQILDSTIRSDLEIGQVNPLYKFLVDSNSSLMNKWCSLYTTDTSFLKQTQKCIKRYTCESYSCDTFKTEYKRFGNETNFIEKYQYIGFKCLKNLNESSSFLHCLSLYNLTSPIFSLLSPLVMLLIPFMILKMQNIPVSISSYIEHLKKIFKNTSIYKLFFNFTSVSFQSRVSAIFSLFIYLLQVYQNILSCVSFYRNITTIYKFLMDYKSHLQQSLLLLDQVSGNIQSYSSYHGFLQEIVTQKEKILKVIGKLSLVRPCESIVSKIGQIGIMMNLYYDIFMKEDHHPLISYTFFIHEFNRDILSIQKAVKSKLLKACKYKKKTEMKGFYYLAHINEPNVRNHVDLKDNLLISGPNASGKTTILKSVFLNVIMSQQFGYGCYEKASIRCYDNFHSYLNIPDTSGRDSLFQAEARRCKEILDCITEQPDKSHLCIFDEIYSGTNPNDAVTCAKLYLNGMNKHKNKVDYMITTHYIEVCEHFRNKPYVKNKKMNVKENAEKIEYDYKMVDGISYVNGGIFILKQLGYPSYLYESV
jgi:hypothetical protein